VEFILLAAAQLALLAVPVALGAAAVRFGLLAEPREAISALNVFALYFGFPALVFVGLLDPHFALPSEPAFWLVVPLAQVPLVLALRVALRWYGRADQAGTMALSTLFGNVAYLGLPLVMVLFDPALRGVAALAVSIHVTVAVLLGPLVLRAWSGVDASRGELLGVLRQPLLWAPLAGLVARGLPDRVMGILEQAARPLSAAAAPVALFLLGVYLFSHRATLIGRVPGASAHVVVRLLVAPLWTFAVVFAFVRLGYLAPSHARIFVVLAGVPAAITTFSIAHAAGIGQTRVAAVIVRSSVFCLVTLPFVFALSRVI
jgi:malonate transporter